MDSYEELVQQLQSALMHLYDPGYDFASDVYAAVGCRPAEGRWPVQTAIVQAIQRLKPQATVPASSRLCLDYDVLHHRFVLGLTQEETAEYLNISTRSVQRVQREAIHLLAAGLKQQSSPVAVSATDSHEKADASLSAQEEWLSQVRREVTSLRENAPDPECELGLTIDGVLRLALLSKLPPIRVVPMGPQDVRVRVHAPVLRQVLLRVLVELKRIAPSEEITLDAGVEHDEAWISFAAKPAGMQYAIDVALFHELLAPYGGSVQPNVAEGRIAITVRVPRAVHFARKYRVLIVDDNDDLVSVYAAYCAGTAFELVPICEGRQVFQTIAAAKPDAIVLDVILPDVDGWDLLMDLHANPASRTIPIVVCSVIDDERLALALGATLCLRKPVRQEQFLGALQRAISPAAVDALTGCASSPEAC
jgi:CheY-like chemotaxis protein